MILHTWVLSILKIKIISHNSLEVIVCKVLSAYLPPLSPPLLAYTEWISSLNSRLFCTLLVGGELESIPCHLILCSIFFSLGSFQRLNPLLPTWGLGHELWMTTWGSVPALPLTLITCASVLFSDPRLMSKWWLMCLRTQALSGWWVLPCHHAPTSFNLLTHCSSRAASYRLLPRTHRQHHMQALL